jgi:hypothetical protein
MVTLRPIITNSLYLCRVILSFLKRDLEIVSDRPTFLSVHKRPWIFNVPDLSWMSLNFSWPFLSSSCLKKVTNGLKRPWNVKSLHEFLYWLIEAKRVYPYSVFFHELKRILNKCQFVRSSVWFKAKTMFYSSADY